MSLFQLLFSRHKSLIYTAIGSPEYIRVVYKLEAAGVSFRTRAYHDHQQHSGSFSIPSKKDYTQYDIYVAKEDEHKAQVAIHAR